MIHDVENLLNPMWCYTNRGRVKHLVGEYDKVLAAACGFVPVYCWRTTDKPMRRCLECVKAQQSKIKQLQKQINQLL